MAIPNTFAPVPALPNFSIEDIPHLGRLTALLRLSRGINRVAPLAVALNISESSITRHEDGETHSTAYFERLIEGLQEEQIDQFVVRTPLTEDEAKLLLDLEKQNRTKGRRRTLYEVLNDIDLKNLYRQIGPTPSPKSRTKKRKGSPTYAKIVGELEEQTNPAFIADRLWHIHAINGAAFRLFDIDAQSASGSKYLKRWQAWHVMAAKFTNPSPVRDKTVETNRYFPPTIDAFFRDIYPFLFTPQVRALLSELHTMSKDYAKSQKKDGSKQEDLGFGRMWESSVTLKSFIKQEEALYRAIIYKNMQIQAIARNRKEWIVYPNNSHPVLYWMGVWEPFDPPADEAFKDLQQYSDSRTIYYAAKYQSDKRAFHASAWPKVIALGKHLDATDSF